MNSGLFSLKDGKLVRVVHPVGQGTPEGEPEPIAVPLETSKSTTVGDRIRAGNVPVKTNSIKDLLKTNSVRDLLIRGKKGNIIGKVGGSKVRTDSKESPYYNLLESWWCGNNGLTPEEREAEKNKALDKVKAESVTPFYDALVQEDFTTGDVASFELPLRKSGLFTQFDKELEKKKKKYYKLAMISASMAGAGASY
jgi:hypothetical protein